MQPIMAFLIVAGAGPHVGPSSLDDAVRRYDQAQIQGDLHALEGLLADDYLLVSSGGEVEDKRQFIADLTAPGYKLKPFTVARPIERRWAGGAVMGGVARLEGTSGGSPFSVCLRFADVWRLSAGRWQVAYSQAARAKPGERGCAPG